MGLLCALLPNGLICGNAQPVLINNKPYLLTCSHLVIGAARFAYEGSIISCKFKCISTRVDLALLRWYTHGRRQYMAIVEPRVDQLQCQTAIVVRPPGDLHNIQPGDCGAEDAGELIYSKFCRMPPGTVYRFVEGYRRFGRNVAPPEVPYIIGYSIAAIDDVPAPAAYVYLAQKFPGDMVAVALYCPEHTVVVHFRLRECIFDF